MPRKFGGGERSDLTESSNEYTFDQNQWGVVKDGEYAETTGLGPCLGIVVYDRKGNKALIGHFPSPEDDGAMEPMLRRVQRFKDKTRLDVYLGGCAPMKSEFDPKLSAETRKHLDIRNTRQYVLDELAKCGITPDKIVAQWTKFADQSSVVSVDTKTGEVLIDIVDHI